MSVLLQFVDGGNDVGKVSGGVVVVEERFSFGCVVLPVHVVDSSGWLGLWLLL